MAPTGLTTPAGRQISSGTSGAPAGPGTSRELSSYAPPRRSSSSVGGGTGPPACRSSGIASSVNGGASRSAMTASAGTSSASNGGGGPHGIASEPSAAETVVTALSFRVRDTTRGKDDDSRHRPARQWCADQSS